MTDRDDDYSDDLRDEKYIKRNVWEYAGPGWIKADELEEEEEE